MGSDFWQAAWPAFAVIAAVYAVWWIIKIFFTRACWRCVTPVLPSKRRTLLLGFLPLVKCGRCGAWRGYILK
jgi:hypothetical protein